MLMRRWVCLGLLAGIPLALVRPAQAAVSQQEFDGLQKEIEDLRSRLAKKNAAPTTAAPISRAERITDNKYGPNAKVTTKTGSLSISGLLQVQSIFIQNDQMDYNWVRRNSNELNDNNTTRIRRAELKFGLDLTDDISAVIMVDPTGGDENNTYPSLPTNQGLNGREVGNALQAASLTNLSIVGTPLNSLSSSSSSESSHQDAASFREQFLSGSTLANRFVQDAYINYHPKFIKNTDFTLGQFKAPVGEEGNRNSAQLDFVERAMINQFSNERDMGLMAHGSWWQQGRFQFWVAVMNGPGSYHQTFSSFQNRADDNDQKDLSSKFLLRPLWKHEKFGSLEFGYSRSDGVHGESGKGFSGTAYNAAGQFTATTAAPSTNGLSIERSHAYRNWAWLFYRPTGPVKGWWIRGEWGNFNDRPTPGFGSFNNLVLQPAQLKRSGFYGSTGYKLSESIWADKLKDGNFLFKMMHDVEFAYRYERFGNLLTDDLSTPKYRTDVFNTTVQTLGINYYWKGYNARTQLNYLMVDEDEGHGAFLPPTAGATPVYYSKRIREVKNDVFVIQHQISF